jgi:hypothetical protein
MPFMCDFLLLCTILSDAILTRPISWHHPHSVLVGTAVVSSLLLQFAIAQQVCQNSSVVRDVDLPLVL